MRHNKLICMLLTMVMLFAMVTPVMAGEDIAIRLDDKFLNFEVKPQIVNDRTMVPLRPILEALNATIEWDDTTKTVTSTKGNTTIKLTMNDPVMYVNGVAKTLDSPACLIQDRTLVPARAISEAFGISVGWDFRSRIVLMSSTSTQIKMYKPDGTTTYVEMAKVDEYKGNNWFVAEPVAMYNEAGETKYVEQTDVKDNEKEGWSKTKPVKIYTLDGRTKYVKPTEVEAYKKVGWYDSPIITIYADDGRTKKIPTSQKEAYLKVGWYDSPIITVYTEDGRTKKIPTSQKEAYLKVGWYDSPVITMYAEDGRTKKIPSSQKDAYVKAGWYDGPVITVYSADGRTKKIGSNEKAAYLKVGWYETPVVTVRSLDGRSKVIKKTDLEAYKKVGWYHIPLITLQTEELKKAVMLNGTNITYIKNYINPSEIQQFKYKNEGIAYAYMDNNKLVVSTPSKTFKVTAKYSSLGDVIADDNGNIYVVWGEEDKTSTSQKAKTIFISKYNEKGEHVVTTGFEGEGSSTKTNINTKIPFYGGNCDSVITPDGKLVVTYGRKMYNGHQSNNVIAVRISTMTKTSTDWKIPYTSHSFNQRVIWSNLAKDLVFADLGDANDRGFVITIKSRERNVFNFYLQPDANYNMSIVNKTFAQLGGLVETDKGVVLIGASAKSIGPAATKEVQNLFVQVINPNVKTLGPEMFVGGTTRTGKTSPDINDTKEKDIPLKEVTDYGVQWITNSTTHNVVGPHSLVVNNKIVILWNNVEKATGKREAYYTVLASDGKIVVPPTSLGKDVVFNSAEDPIYHNGRIYWMAMKNGNIQKMSINMPE